MKTKQTFFKLLFAIIVLTQTTQAQETAKGIKDLSPKNCGRVTCPTCGGNTGTYKTIGNSNKNEVEDIGIGTTWDIGRRSRNCGGFGLCRCSSVTFEYSQRVKTKENSFNSIVSLNAENKLLSRVDQMSERIINKYFGGSQIIVEEDFVIEDPEILKKLHLESYIIKKGVYKLKFNSKTKIYETTF
ncbi:hypothetical protein [Flavobacterium sp. XS1P27]|uniref:hypothetical protein n=1 Tax=unclassified Flavobacterium TaxID=196869 RepID=UPI003AAA7739